MRMHVADDTLAFVIDGCRVRVTDQEEMSTVWSQDYRTALDAWVAFLWLLNDRYGPTETDRRVYVGAESYRT